MPLKWTKAISLLLLMLSFQSHAVPSSQKSWSSVGKVTLSILWFDVYQAQLFSESGAYLEGEPIKLTITYLRDFKADELIDETRKQWKEKVGKDNINKWLSQLRHIWPDIKENDVLTLYIDDNEAAHFEQGERYLGAIDEPQFGRAFSDIWLSPTSSYPKLAAVLRGEVNEK
jgi:hypothetical protein